MRLRTLLPRLVLLAPLAGALLGLLAMSSLLRLWPLPPTLLLAYAGAGVALGLVPALLANGSTLPGTLAVTVPVLAAAAYDQSRLDWLRLLKDYGVAAPGTPDLLRLALGVAALLLAWGLHVVDTSLRLQWSAQDRGFPDAQARAAARRVRAEGARVAGLALAGTIALGGLAVLAARLDLTAVLGGRASLVAPLLAVGLLAFAAVLLWVERGRRAGDS